MNGPFDKNDDVQGLANHLGQDLHISSSGSISTSRSETIAENMRSEDGTNTTTGGNCGQSPDNVSDDGKE